MYVPYHQHTSFSIADGVATSEGYVERANELGLKALGISDHGVCHGWVSHTKACNEGGIIPVIGIEAYVLDIGAKSDDRGGHCVIIVLNETGYNNLLYLVDKSYSNFYFKPRIPADLLFLRNEGLLVTSACRAGIFGKHILDKEGNYIPSGEEIAETRYKAWHNVFGDRLKGEVQPEYDVKNNQYYCNQFIRRVFKPENIWFASDSHYVYKGENDLQNAMKSAISEEFSPYEDYYYLWSYEEACNATGIRKEDVDNTNELLERVKFKLVLDTPKLPAIVIPNDEEEIGPTGHDYNTYLHKLSFTGLRERIQGYGEVYNKRLQYELKVMKDNGTASYLVMNYDVFRELRRQGITYGPRGSACGSLVAYCLYLHDIDPIRHNIMFERFMTPGRKSLPDIDYDLYTPDRDRAFQILKDMYGEDSVSRIVTFHRFMLKSSLQAIGRHYKIDKADVKLLSEYVKFEKDSDKSAFEQFRQNVILEEGSDIIEDYKRRDTNYRLWLTNVEKICELELPSTLSIHACGCVVTSREKPIAQTWPVCYKDGQIAVQYDMEDIEAAGGVKIDLLGLSSLYPINMALKALELKPSQIPTDDPAVFDFIQNDSMTGLFQAKNFNMKKLIRDIKPVALRDLALAVAAFRPAVLHSGLQNTYVSRKNGEELVTYPHPDLAKVLEDTYGVFIYQDHILGACKAVGMTDMEADEVRKATAKKKPEKIKALKGLWLEKTKAKGWTVETSEQVWRIIEDAAGYGFNFSHALTYGRWLYISAWIKLYYTDIFFASSLTARQDAPKNEDEGNLFKELLADCKKHSPYDSNIKLKPPCINNAIEEFVYNDWDNSITFSLAAIKGMGQDVARWFKANGPYKNLADIIKKVENSKVRIDLYKRSESKLIKKYKTYTEKGKAFNILKFSKGTVARKKKGQQELDIGTMATKFSNDEEIYSHTDYIILSSLDCCWHMGLTGIDYASLYSQCFNPKYRSIANLGHVEALIKAGALDQFGKRPNLLKSLFFKKFSAKKDTGMLSTDKELLQWLDTCIQGNIVNTNKTIGAQLIFKFAYEDKRREAKEKYFRYCFNAVDKNEDTVMKDYSGFISTDFGGDLFMEADYGRQLTLVGKITSFTKDKKTKQGKPFLSFTIACSSGDVSCMVFDNVEKYMDMLEKENMVIVVGKKNKDRFNKGKQMLFVKTMQLK